MRGIWDNKVLFWHFVFLTLLKTAVGPAFQYAALNEGESVFTAQEIIAGTNAYRNSENVSVLKENVVLNVAAAQKLDDMVRDQYFAHFSPSGVSPWHWFQVNQYQYSNAGENLAIGYSDAQATIDAWARSPTHRNNLLNPVFREIGVATAAVTINGDRGVLVVQLFGTPAKPVSTGTSQEKDTRGVSFGLSESGASETTSTPQPGRSEPEILPGAPKKIAVVPRSTSVEDSVPETVRILNQGFTFYVYIVVVLGMGYLLFREYRRELVPKIALYILLFLLSAVLPIMSAAQHARIQ